VDGGLEDGILGQAEGELVAEGHGPLAGGDEQQDTVGQDGFGGQAHPALDEDGRLTGARAPQDEQGPALVRDNPSLSFVQAEFSRTHRSIP